MELNNFTPVKTMLPDMKMLNKLLRQIEELLELGPVIKDILSSITLEVVSILKWQELLNQWRNLSDNQSKIPFSKLCF
jgi:hypothetical protein